MGRIGFTLLGAAVGLVCVFGLVAEEQDQDGRTVSFDMPACPIKQISVPPTKTEFELPEKNPLGAPFSVMGTIQVADQSGGVIFKVSTVAAADLTGIQFARTVNTIAHATGSMSFDRGCTSTDPYGSNNCTWAWDDRITESHQGALQEDITSGKLVVDLKVNSVIPLSFSCPICGASCKIPIPQELKQGRWNDMWRLMIRLIGFSFDTVGAPLRN